MVRRKQIITLEGKDYKLKKCPFCGNHLVDLYTEDSKYGYPISTAYVYCPMCDAQGPAIEQPDLTDGLKIEVIRRWNKRK